MSDILSDPRLTDEDDPEQVAQYASVDEYLARKAHFVDESPETAIEDVSEPS